MLQDIFCKSILSKDPLLQSMLEYSAKKYNLRNHLSPVESESQLDMLPRSTCHICYESFLDSELWLGCGQRSSRNNTDGYCKQCMEAYLISQIIDAKMTKGGTIQCPCRFCDKSLDKEEIYSLVQEDIYQKFTHFMNSKIVDENPLIRWCPRPNCNTAVQLQSLSSSRGYCQKCYLNFCAKCSGVHRSVFSCTLSADFNFHQWKATTQQGCKRCPGCKLFIEKNEGCNHMKCARCFHEFCWLCSSDWKGRCTSIRSYCHACKILDDPMWGKSLISRVILKTIALPIGIAVGGTLVGVGIGTAGVVAGAACIGAVTVGSAAVVVAPIHYGYKFGKRLRLTSKGLKLTPPVSFEDQDTSTLETLSKGVRVICNWDTDDTKYLTELSIGNNESFLGLNGRLQYGVFIAYSNFVSIQGLTRSVLLYFVPRDVNYELLMELMPNPMIEVLFPYVTVPEPRRQPITYRHFRIALNSKITNAVENRHQVYPSEYYPALTRRIATIYYSDDYENVVVDESQYFDPESGLPVDRNSSSGRRPSSSFDVDLDPTSIDLELDSEERKSNDDDDKDIYSNNNSSNNNSHHYEIEKITRRTFQKYRCENSVDHSFRDSECNIQYSMDMIDIELQDEVEFEDEGVTLPSSLMKYCSSSSSSSSSSTDDRYEYHDHNHDMREDEEDNSITEMEPQMRDIDGDDVDGGQPCEREEIETDIIVEKSSMINGEI